MRNMRVTLPGLLVLLASMGCSGGDSLSRKEIRGGLAAGGGGAQQSGPKRKLDPASGGTISGTVKWEGAKPTREKIDVSGTPDCMKASKETIYDEKLVVNDNNTVRYCLVSIDTNDAYEPPAEPVLVDQLGCHYAPHVFGVVANQKIKIKSSDPTTHNVHYIPTGTDNTEDNFGMTAGSPDKTRVFEFPDRVRFKCDVHPWMGAWCIVKSHPFFAVSGEDGTYTIKNVPAGTHKLVMLQEKLGEQTVTVTVDAGGTTKQDFTLKQ